MMNIENKTQENKKYSQSLVHADTATGRPVPGRVIKNADGSLSIPARVIPLPGNLSEEARLFLTKTRTTVLDNMDKFNFQQYLKQMDDTHTRMSKDCEKYFPVTKGKCVLGNIECDEIYPGSGVPSIHKSRVLINVVSGSNIAGNENFIEAIPVASIAGLRVIKPRYRFLPDYPFPCPVDDIVSVYKCLLESHAPQSIGMYGASSGGTMIFQVVYKLLTLGLPVPGAIGSWGGSGSPLLQTDTDYTNIDLDEFVSQLDTSSMIFMTEEAKSIRESIQKIDPLDPAYSPLYANLSGYPPTFLATGMREVGLGAMALMNRALVRAGVDTCFLTFEGLSHAFIFFPQLPEAKELYRACANFLLKKLQK